MITLPLPKPCGIHSLVPLLNVLLPWLFRAWMIVVPVQSFDGFEIEIDPLTVPAEHNDKLNGPVIFPAMGPLNPPLPPMVASPINSTFPAITHPPEVRMAPMPCSCRAASPAIYISFLMGEPVPAMNKYPLGKI